MQGHGAASTPGRHPAATASRYWMCLLLLSLALVSSLLLAIQSLGGMSLPGCGIDSACVQATSSALGRVPLIGWPTSYLGCAYFGALAASWVAARGQLHRLLLGMAITGVLISIILVAGMFAGGYLCPYCMVVHGANVLFLLAAMQCVEEEHPRWRRSFIGVFAGITLLLLVVHGAVSSRVESTREADRVASVDRILGAGNGDHDGVQAPFTGRWREGPESAAIRIVIFSDYQCPDCRRIENQVQQVLREQEDVSFSAKHFPMCTSCNAIAPNLHPNACWAARLAEAAGILGGEASFRAMHRWLFEVEGRFENAGQIAPGAAAAGVDLDELISLMQGPRTEALVLADIEEALRLGVHYTPMIFVNGVELKGFMAQEALLKTVRAVAATHPPLRTAASDHPAVAVTKYISDWREATRLSSRVVDAGDWSQGAADTPLQIVVWGDYTEPTTERLDRLVRARIDGLDGVRYSFRNYPISTACNPGSRFSQVDTFEHGCLAAQAAEAAGRLGGRDSYWRMHAWLFEHRARLGADAMRVAAVAVGLDPDQFLSMIESPDVARALQEDIDAGNRAGLRSLPWVFIDGRRPPRVHLDGADIPAMIIDAALEELGQTL